MFAGCLAMAWALAAPCHDAAAARPRTAARNPANRGLPAGNVAARQGKTQVLYGISWHPSIPSALKAASNMPADSKTAGDTTARDKSRRGKSPSEKGKPVFAFRVLGDLSGFM